MDDPRLTPARGDIAAKHLEGKVKAERYVAGEICEIIEPVAPVRERVDKDGLLYVTWFGAGLRIIDINDPANPKERGYFIPKPGNGLAAPLTNDVAMDDRGLLFVTDKTRGFDLSLEIFRGKVGPCRRDARVIHSVRPAICRSPARPGIRRLPAAPASPMASSRRYQDAASFSRPRRNAAGTGRR